MSTTSALSCVPRAFPASNRKMYSRCIEGMGRGLPALMRALLQACESVLTQAGVSFRVPRSKLNAEHALHPTTPKGWPTDQRTDHTPMTGPGSAVHPGTPCTPMRHPTEARYSLSAGPPRDHVISYLRQHRHRAERARPAQRIRRTRSSEGDGTCDAARAAREIRSLSFGVEL